MKVSKWEFGGIFLIYGLGIFLHYLYKMSDYNQYVALFTPTKETIWEHLKIVFYSMAGFALFEYAFIGEKYKNFIFAKVLSTILACILVVVLYRGYTNFIDPKLYLDLVIFFIAILIAQIFSFGILKSGLMIKGLNYWGLIIFIICTVLFTSFTYKIPQDNWVFTEELKHH